MTRANRHFVPNQVWHITHRCHKREFLLKFSRDRAKWQGWLFEAKKRFGLRILNYMVTSNHVHLLVFDDGKDAIAQSMQLVAGRVAQEFNDRKGRRGAFWEDRYHATAVESNEHLMRCLGYVDLNMVRAGAVKHPSEWEHSGYLEIQHPPKRYRIVDHECLWNLCGFEGGEEFRIFHRQCVDTMLSCGSKRDDSWTQSIAVGSTAFVDEMKSILGPRAKGRKSYDVGGNAVLREDTLSYGRSFGPEKAVLSPDNTYLWNECVEIIGA